MTAANKHAGMDSQHAPTIGDGDVPPINAPVHVAFARDLHREYIHRLARAPEPTVMRALYGLDSACNWSMIVLANVA